MGRVIGLALLFAVAAAVPAVADEARQAADDAAGAARSAGAGQTGVVGVPGSRFLAPPSSQRSGLEAPWLAVGVAGLASPRQEPRPWIVLPWLDEGLALPLTERFSLGVDYQNIRGEDLWQEFAETGSMDYDSHNFIVRAHWRF